ncbi:MULTISPECIES: FG-GAP-like repeat-containing protein [Streptomyces]|uniref:FG-GAP-like repeat-containing protein n=1 Tax=Streptomyces sudanensis TaxID=436397 RepID=A0ABY4TBK4_9ACTN|nr:MULTISPECIES: FG-GAP-like repeat-containing protein [Streptomyces]URN16347.1 FG-GAP-like repeat-containing protein [Streptomyces sudanensis]
MRVSLLRRLAALAAALGLTSLGLLGASAAPAQAAIGDCPAGYFCAWKTDNGTGTMYKTNSDRASLGTWDNTFRSVVNRTSRFACVHDDPDYGQDGMVGIWSPDPAGTEWGYEHGTVSSVRFVSTSRECSYPPYPRWHSAPSPREAGFGDLNGDRKADVLVRDRAGRLWFLPGDGTGQLVGNGGWNAFNGLVRHGDFGGDGREDVIAREAATGRLWLYPGTGTGALGARKLIGNSGWNAMSRLVGYGDLSGDGRTDLLAVEKATGRLWLYPGTGTGALGARKLVGNGGWNAMNALVGAGDMNSDGRPDLIAREPSTGKLWLYPGRTGALGARVLIGNGGWNVMAEFLGLGDIGGDGHADLATTTRPEFVSPECRGVGCQLAYSGRGTGSLHPGQVAADDWHHLNGVF